MNNIIKGLIKNILLKTILKQLIGALPFLAWPVIGPLFSFFVGFILDKALDEMSLFIDFTRIAYRNDKFRREFDQAGLALQIIGDQKGIDSDEFEKARLEFEDRLSDLLVHEPS